MLLVYCTTYMLDLMNVYSAIAINNKVVEAKKRGTDLKPVSDVKYNEDTKRYSVYIKGNQSIDLEDVKIGETIFTYYIGNMDGAAILNLEDGPALSTTNFDNLTDRKDTDDGINLKFMGKEYKGLSAMEGFFSVSMNKDGKFDVHFLQGNGKDFEIETLGCIKVLGITEDTANLRLSTSYKFYEPKLEVNYCTVLDTDSFYYDEVNEALLKNTSSDFAYNFMIGSKLPVVGVSMLGLLVMLYLVKRTKKFSILSRREPLIINIILTIISFSLVLFFTFNFLL